MGTCVGCTQGRASSRTPRPCDLLRVVVRRQVAALGGLGHVARDDRLLEREGDAVQQVRVAQLELARRPVVVCVGREDVADGRRSGRGGRTRRAGAGEVEVFVLGDVQQHVDHVDENRPVVRGLSRLGELLLRAAHDGDGHAANVHGLLVLRDLA